MEKLFIIREGVSKNKHGLIGSHIAAKRNLLYRILISTNKN